MQPTAITADSLLSRSFSIFRSGFVSFVSLALIFYSPVILVRLIVSSQSSADSVDAALSGFFVLVAILLMFPFASAALAHGVSQGMRGQATTITQCIQVATSRAPSILGVAIVSSTMSLLGYLMCFLPGIVIFCGFFLAGPIVVIETKEPLDALRRSWALTDGHKFHIFGLYFAIVILQLGFNLLVHSAFGTDTFNLNEPPITGNALQTILTDVIAVLTTAFSGVAAAVAYHDILSFRDTHSPAP